jgi:hypothetical protein
MAIIVSKNNHGLDHERYERLKAAILSLDYRIYRFETVESHQNNGVPAFPDILLRLEQQPVGSSGAKDSLEDLALRLWAYFEELREEPPLPVEGKIVADIVEMLVDARVVMI